MGSVPNSQYEISTRYGIRWFKCKLKPPKNPVRKEDEINPVKMKTHANAILT